MVHRYNGAQRGGSSDPAHQRDKTPGIHD
jgi:hypothetical protein